MKIEHIALNVAEPVEMAAWYVEHIGLRIVRQSDGGDFVTFLVDSAGATVLELYSNSQADYPDFASLSRYAFHIALSVTNIEQETARLIAAGATIDHPIENRDSGDRLGFVRDPWGVSLQMVERYVPLLGQ